MVVLLLIVGGGGVLGVGCQAPPQRLPPPVVPSGTLRSNLLLTPWDVTPPRTELPFALAAGPGIPGSLPGLAPDRPPSAEVSEAVRETVVLWSRLKNQALPIEERAQDLLAVASPDCTIGRYGLPGVGSQRELFARAFVRFIDDVSPDVQAFRPPWQYHELRADEFMRLPPNAIQGWHQQLRIPDLAALMRAGARIVLLNSPPPMGRWMLCTLWMPDGTHVGAMHVVALSHIAWREINAAAAAEAAVEAQASDSAPPP